MSIKLMTKAWETDQKGNDLLVLLAMCDFASDEGVLFPSLKTLGNKAKVAKTTLSYILNAYEEIGVITRTQRKRENNSDTSTIYQINHLNIDLAKYKEAYQKARNYKKSSQCEHGGNDKIVNTQDHNVNTQSANCEHLEPSILNHQGITINKNKQKENFSFTLKVKSTIENTKSEYQENLKAYILESGKPMSYEDFYNSCVMQGYKYKNFKLAYDSWNKKKPKQTTPVNNSKTRNQTNNDAISEYFANQHKTPEDIQDVEVMN